jgi:hypothetical protein
VTEEFVVTLMHINNAEKQALELLYMMHQLSERTNINLTESEAYIGRVLKQLKEAVAK